MSRLRVTGGRYKGMFVEVPKGDLEIRPAMDIMRESVFSVLGDISGLSFLDLFSGSGIIAIEAASRGASPVFCVEKDRKKLPVLIRNTGISEGRIECHAIPAESFIKRCKQQFNLIFADPPFPYKYKKELLMQLAESQVLAGGGIFLLHHPYREDLPDSVSDLSVFDKRRYGNSLVRFYRQNAIGQDSL